MKVLFLLKDIVTKVTRISPKLASVADNEDITHIKNQNSFTFVKHLLACNGFTGFDSTFA
jgi:hypothetical protein